MIILLIVIDLPSTATEISLITPVTLAEHGLSLPTPHNPTPPPKYLSLEDLMSIPIESSCM